MERRVTAAFTLIELMVILIIVGITLTFAALSLGDLGQSRKLRYQLDQFIQLFHLAKVRAMLEPNVLGIEFKASSYQFFRYDVSSDLKNGPPWLPIQSNIFRKNFKLPPSSWYKLNVPHNPFLAAIPKQIVHPQVLIFPSGEITPFHLDIGIKGSGALYQVDADANGTLRLTSSTHSLPS